MTETAAAAEAEPLPEDRARADYYALIARLFHAGPDAALLGALAAIGRETSADKGGATPLALALGVLASTAAGADAEALQAEYDLAFIGTGRAEITPYASHYRADRMKEQVLVRLRDDLDRMGLARSRGVAEYEDHFSGLCDVMRHLILGGSGDVAVQEQKRFFLAYLAPSYAGFCVAVVASPNTDFYKHVAGFTKVFLDIEGRSFEMM